MTLAKYSHALAERERSEDIVAKLAAAGIGVPSHQEGLAK